MKQKYIITLEPNQDKREFLELLAREGYEIASLSPSLKRIFTAMLTTQERLNLFQKDGILAIEEDMEVDLETIAYKPAVRMKNLITRYSPGGTEDGSNFAPTHFYYGSDHKLKNSDTIDFFISNKTRSNNESIEQNFSGTFVDIVAIEAGAPATSYDGYENHPDFLDKNGNTRFQFMNWSDYNSACTSTANNQSNKSFVFSNHAIGVLSAAGGTSCGWCNVSSLRVIYLTDNVVDVYDAVLAWHKAKPINPATGKRNATITTGSWGYTSVSHEYAVRIADINTLRYYNEQGQLTIINRPVGGWGSDLSQFERALMPPRAINNPDTNVDEWYISVGRESRGVFFDDAMSDFNQEDGLYHFKSAGNNAKVYVKPTDPRWNNRIDVDSNTKQIKFTIQNGQFKLSSQSIFTFTNSGYPCRSYINGSANCFTVGASQNSNINPLLDDYSSRGPGVDIFGFGEYTYTSYPIQLRGAYRWGYFGGTSCAAPVVAGAAGVYVDWWYSMTGKYPTFEELLEVMTAESQPVLQEDEAVDFSNTPTANDNGYSSSRLYSGFKLHRIRENDYINGSLELSKLYESKNRRVFIPWYIRKGTGQNIINPSKNTKGEQNTFGQAYPRRTISFSV